MVMGENDFLLIVSELVMTDCESSLNLLICFFELQLQYRLLMSHEFYSVK